MDNGVTAAAALVGAVTGDHRLVVNRSAPLEIARELVLRSYLHDRQRTLHHQQGDFYQWRSSHYATTPDEQIEAIICRFLDTAYRIEKDKVVAFEPTPRDVANVMAMLRMERQLLEETRAPAWLDRRPHPRAGEVFACRNGLLHLPTKLLYPHTPAFFGLNSVDYEFDPRLPPPREWLKFLGSIWPNDSETIATLQEIFAYMLCGYTEQQKAILIVGPPRSGKGTIGRVLTGLLGKENVVGPSLTSLSERFGLEPLIGKPLAVISDARLSGRADHQVAIERLLSITGEDQMTIDRKNRATWTGTLPTRFLILTNELPRLIDASGALASRFIVLRLQRDFRGREDHGLTDRLMAELPAILNWAAAGLLGLTTRGRFRQPESARQSIEILEDLASPISVFLRDWTTIGAGKHVECGLLFTAWGVWCKRHGRDHPGNAQTFGRDLRAALPTIEISRPQNGGGSRARHYEGIGLTEEASTAILASAQVAVAAGAG